MADQNKVCDLCQGNQFEVICRRDRRGKPLNTVVCLGCGLVGHETVPTEQELDHYYARCYRQEYHGEQTPSTRRVWRAWLRGERMLNTLKPHLAPGARVFEVGAGTGCTVKVFELNGFDASGIEPGVGFQRFARDWLRAKVHQSSLFEYQASAPFDVVLFPHVIEHMRSPRQALQAIHRLLKPTGLLYLECPSLASPCRKISEQFHFAHIYTFTPIPLLTLLRQSGFVVRHCFGDGVGKNFRLLLARTEPSACPIDPAGLEQTRAILRQYQDPWRRFRPRYLARRAERVAGYLREYLLGRLAVRRIYQITGSAPRKAA
jgi:SAM-dependent methyltransferase